MVVKDDHSFNHSLSQYIFSSPLYLSPSCCVYFSLLFGFILFFCSFFLFCFCDLHSIFVNMIVFPLHPYFSVPFMHSSSYDHPFLFCFSTSPYHFCSGSLFLYTNINIQIYTVVRVGLTNSNKSLTSKNQLLHKTNLYVTKTNRIPVRCI